MVYGDDTQVAREIFHDVDLEREDGWTILFRGNEAILRVRDEHVQSLEHVDDNQAVWASLSSSNENQRVPGHTATNMTSTSG